TPWQRRAGCILASWSSPHERGDKTRLDLRPQPRGPTATGAGSSSRRRVHLVGRVLQRVLAFLAALADRLGLDVGGVRAGTAGFHGFEEVGLRLIGFIDRGRGSFHLVLGLTVPRGRRESEPGGRRHDGEILHWVPLSEKL